MRHVDNTSRSEDSVYDIILGKSDAANETGNGTEDLNYEYKDDDLDGQILDHDALKKVIYRIEERYGEQIDLRRLGAAAHGQSRYVKSKCVNMIRQSIYYVKGRMNDTMPFRQKYKNHHGYQIAVLYGAATAMINKMESLYGQMKRLPWRTHFLWYLVLYEKVLACNIDISNMIERIFLLQEQYLVVRGPKEKSSKMSKMDKSKLANQQDNKKS